MSTRVHPATSSTDPAAAGFLGFIDACAAGGPDAVKAHLTKAMLDFLENSGQLASFCSQYAGQAKEFATSIDRGSARVLPFDATTMKGMPSWCKRYVVDATRGGVRGTVSFIGALRGNVLTGAGDGNGLMFAGVAVLSDKFHNLQPRLIYRPHSWVTIRASLELGGNDPAMLSKRPNRDAAGFLDFIDACAAGGPDAVKAHLTKAMLDFLENSGQLESFCSQYAGQAKEFANTLDRGSARVLPYDGKPDWCKQYVVNATHGEENGMLCFLGYFHNDILSGAGNGAGLAFLPGASVDSLNQEQTRKPTASHYLVIAPLPRSMERDGVPRYALHEAKIECEDKVDVPGLEHYVAALIPAASLSKTVVTHKFVRLSTRLISHEDTVPPGWRITPPVHGRGAWTKPPDGRSLDALRPGQVGGADPKRFERLSKLAAEYGFTLRGENEKDWHYARRAQQFLNSRVRYDAAAAGSANDGKEPAHCVTSRVAHCGNYSSGYRELLSLGGVLCRSAVGEWIDTRGKCHCVNDVFLEGCGWIPVEPAKDPTTAYDADPKDWGPPSFIGHPSFGVCDDMFITDHNDGARSDAGHVSDVNILFHGSCGDEKDEKEQLMELVSSLFMRFDTNGNGKLEMPEARNMISTLLNINEHWSGASEALNAAAHALDLNREGTVSREDLLAAIADKDRGVAHLLVSASKQVKIGQNIAQVRPVHGGNLVDNKVQGQVGNPITCVGHGLMSQYEACNYIAGKKWLQKILSGTHVVFHETNGDGKNCAARQLISDQEMDGLFDTIEGRCQSAYTARYGSKENK
eukprot:g2301.t1